MALNKHVKAARWAKSECRISNSQKIIDLRNSVLETIKTQKKLENPVQPTYDHEDAVARAFMASNLIANIFLGNEGGDDQVSINEI